MYSPYAEQQTIFADAAEPKSIADLRGAGLKIYPFCVKEECSGADACFREQKKKRQRQYQADRRNAQQSLDAFYHAQQAKENRRRRIEAQAAFQKRKEAE